MGRSSHCKNDDGIIRKSTRNLFNNTKKSIYNNNFKQWDTNSKNLLKNFNNQFTFISQEKLHEILHYIIDLPNINEQYVNFESFIKSILDENQLDVNFIYKGTPLLLKALHIINEDYSRKKWWIMKFFIRLLLQYGASIQETFYYYSEQCDHIRLSIRPTILTFINDYYFSDFLSICLELNNLDITLNDYIQTFQQFILKGKSSQLKDFISFLIKKNVYQTCVNSIQKDERFQKKFIKKWTEYEKYLYCYPSLNQYIKFISEVLPEDIILALLSIPFPSGNNFISIMKSWITIKPKHYILLKNFENKIYQSVLMDKWILQSYDTFDNYLQWLPREIFEDSCLSVFNY